MNSLILLINIKLQNHRVVVKSYNLNLSLMVSFSSYYNKNTCDLLNSYKSQANNAKNPF
jgi:hypothetical protein